MSSMKSVFLLFITALVACTGIPVQAQATVPDFSSLEEALKWIDAQETYAEFIHGGKMNYITFDDTRGFVLFPVIINGTETLALLDTGSSGTIIDLELARKNGLKIQDFGKQVEASFSRASQQLVFGVEVVVPGQMRFQSPLSGQDLSGLSDRLGKSIGIVMGMDMLGSIAFAIDGKRKELFFLQSGGLTLHGEGLIRLPVEDKRIVGTIRDKPARFAVDLGNNSDLLVLENSWKRFFGDDPTELIGTSFDVTGRWQKMFGLRQIPVTIGPISSELTVRRFDFEKEGTDAFIGYEFFKENITVFDYAAGHITTGKE